MSEELFGPGATTWLATGGLLLLTALAVSIRAAAEHERVVVTRWGRLVRVGGPGLVLRLPLLEKGATISLRPTQFELGVSVCAADGASVHVRATGRARVTDPARSLLVAPDPIAAAISETEDRLAHEVGHVDLANLLSARVRLETAVTRDVSAVTSTWGVEVEAIELADVEVRLTQDLADRLGAAAQPAGGGDG